MSTTTDLSVLPDDFNLVFFDEKCLTKRGKERGYSFPTARYVHNIVFDVQPENFGIQAKCFRSMGKNDSPHVLNMVVSVSDRSVVCS